MIDITMAGGEGVASVDLLLNDSSQAKGLIRLIFLYENK